MSSNTAGVPRTSPWRSVAALVLAWGAAIVLSDMALGALGARPRIIREVADGLREFEHSNPDILVLGSSHARSFEALGAQLAERTGRRVVVVPEEGGTLHAFNWVLQNRLRPLIEEQDASGRLVRDRLAQVVLVTTYWDTCPVWYTRVEGNLPARAWTLRNFVSDALAHGVTDLNRNYLLSRWKDLWRSSTLVALRAEGHPNETLAQVLRPQPERRARELEARRAHRIGTRLREIEAEGGFCMDASQLHELDETIDYLQSRRLAVTLVLFPLAPETLSPVSRATTLRRYSVYAEELRQRKGIKVVDMSVDSSLAGHDFETDMDHVTPTGNRKFADWALRNDLAFLLAPTSTAADGREKTAEAGS